MLRSPNQKHSSIFREHGSSPLEILVAVVLLTMGLLMLLMVQMTSIAAKSQAVSSKTRTAVRMGQYAVDQLSKAPWDSIRSSSDEGFVEKNGVFAPVTSRLPEAAGDYVSVQGTVYYRLWRVVPDTEIPNLKTITVWCCWKGDGGLWRYATLVTQLADVEYAAE